mmetsp:Transcript_7748/g.30637  ORF Transcript_7748/g.30637 Transcript_7748/m.30637 type:complete len:273 (-) Transcript_7748:260-1078(-)
MKNCSSVRYSNCGPGGLRSVSALSLFVVVVVVVGWLGLGVGVALGRAGCLVVLVVVLGLLALLLLLLLLLLLGLSLLLLLLLRLLAPALRLSLPVELGALLLALLLGASELLVLLGGGLVLLRGVLEDEGRELVPHVDVGDKAAGFALELDGVLLGDVDDRLRVAAAVALHEALDKALEVLREDLRGVRAVDDVRAALLVALGQRAELVAHVLGGVGGRAGESLGDVDHVGDVRLDAVTATLDLGLDRGHLVAVELVAGIGGADVDGSHLSG